MNDLAKLAVQVLFVPALNAAARGMNQIFRRRKRQPTYRYDRKSGHWTAYLDGEHATGVTKAAARMNVKKEIADRDAYQDSLIRQAEEATKR